MPADKVSDETKANPRNCAYVTLLYYVLGTWNTINVIVIVLGQLFMMTAYQDDQLLKETGQEEEYQELIFRFR